MRSLEGDLPKPPERYSRETSRRLMWLLENTTGRVAGDIHIVGKEHLQQIPREKRLIIATTHISDIDEPVTVLALGHDRQMVMANMSIHTNLKQSIQAGDPTIIGILAAGRENFIPIRWGQQEKGLQGKRRRQGIYRTEDINNITEAIKEGKTVVIAAHRPTTKGVLPPNPGYAAVRAAQLTDALVLPIAVQVGAPNEVLGLGEPKNMVRTQRQRPDVTITIGAPIEFTDDAAKEAGDKIESFLQKRTQAPKEITEGDLEEFREARNIMRQQGTRLMQNLASLLPPERQGEWSNSRS